VQYIILLAPWCSRKGCWGIISAPEIGKGSRTVRGVRSAKASKTRIKLGFGLGFPNQANPLHI